MGLVVFTHPSRSGEEERKSLSSSEGVSGIGVRGGLRICLGLVGGVLEGGGRFWVWREMGERSEARMGYSSER